MTSTEAVKLIAAREISTRVRSNAFKITSILMLVAVAGFIVAMKFISASGTNHSTVGVTDASLSAPLQASGKTLGQKITVHVVTEPDGERQVKSGKLDALVTAPDQVVVKKNLDDDGRNVLSLLARQAALDQQIVALHGNPAQVGQAVANTTLHVRSLEHATAYKTQRIFIGIAAGILVYLALMLYGQAVAQGVVEEKSSRIVELLLTAIRPWQLMLGKVIGIGVVGLGQLLVVAAVGVGTAVGTGVLTMPASMAIGAVVWGLIWFLLGFLMFALMFAAMGALVSRQEDAGGVTAPVLMLIIIPYVLGISLLPADPDNGLLRVLSLIPVCAPTLMPMRIALGGVPAWQLALSSGLAVVLIVVLVWLAGRVYRNAVLRTGTRVSLKDALSAA